MNITIIRWDDPPPQQSGRQPGARAVVPGRSLWIPVAEELKRRPGSWALLYEGEQGTASGVASRVIAATGKGVAFAPAGSFEAVSRTVVSSNGRVTRAYARYVGEVTG